MGSGTVYQLLARLSFIASAYAIHVTMAYYLKDPRDYGTLGIVLSLLAIARLFLVQGLPQATSRFIAHDDSRAGDIYAKSMRLQIVVSAIVMLVYVGGIPLWTRLLSDPSLKVYFLWSSPLIPLMGVLQIKYSYLFGSGQYGKQAFFVSVYSVGRFVFAFALVLLGMKVLGVVLGFMVALVVALFMMEMSIKVPKPVGEFSSRELAVFALPIIMYSIGFTLLVNLDILLLKHFFPDSPDIGFYNGAMNIGKAPYVLFVAFGVTGLPMVARARGENNQEKERELVKSLSTRLLIVSLPLAFIVLATPVRLLDLVYPSAYAIASGSLTVLIFSMTGLSFLYLVTSLLTAAGRPRVSMAIIILCLVCQLMFSFYLIPRYGMIGAASSSLFCVVFGITIGSVMVMRVFTTLVDISKVLKALGCSFAIYLVLANIPDFNPYMLVVLYGLSLLAYLGLMVLLGGITSDELKKARNIFSRRDKSASV